MRFEISGEAGGVWFVTGPKKDGICFSIHALPVTNVVFPEDTAWRLLTKAIDRKKAELAAPIFAATATTG